jgi:hypothetical protein
MELVVVMLVEALARRTCGFSEIKTFHRSIDECCLVGAAIGTMLPSSLAQE